MSHMNVSCHRNMSCHTQMIHVRNESCHTSGMSHVTHNRVMLHMNMSCHIWTCHATHQISSLLRAPAATWRLSFQVEHLKSQRLSPFMHRGATISRLLKITGLFCKRALYKRLHSAKRTYNFKEPTDRSHPVVNYNYRTVFTEIFARVIGVPVEFLKSQLATGYTI